MKDHTADSTQQTASDPDLGARAPEKAEYEGVRWEVTPRGVVTHYDVVSAYPYVFQKLPGGSPYGRFGKKEGK